MINSSSSTVTKRLTVCPAHESIYFWLSAINTSSSRGSVFARTALSFVKSINTDPFHAAASSSGSRKTVLRSVDRKNSCFGSRGGSNRSTMMRRVYKSRNWTWFSLSAFVTILIYRTVFYVKRQTVSFTDLFTLFILSLPTGLVRKFFPNPTLRWTHPY